MRFSDEIFVPSFQTGARKKDERAPRRVPAYARSASCRVPARGCMVTRVPQWLRVEKIKKIVSSTLCNFLAE